MSEKKNKKRSWSRRAFMVTGGLVGGGLVVGVGGTIWANHKIKQYSGKGFTEGEHIMNAWVSVGEDNSVTIAVPRAEMGQGVYTAVPMLVAEELEVDLEQVKIFHPQPESPYANTFLLTSQPRNIYKGMTLMEKVASILPVVGTGGSTTIADGYDNMRAAGATARESLIKAAMDRWSVSRDQCYAEKGYVIKRGTNDRLSYGELSKEAAALKIDKIPELKKAKDFKILGRPVKRLDIPDKVTGVAEFGIDVRPDGLLYAAIKHPEYLGGTIASVDNVAEVEAMDGVKKVVILKDGQGVAVIADNTWRAKNGALMLDVTEEDNGSKSLSSKSISATMKSILDNDEMIATPDKEGDVASAFADEASKNIEADYEVPYLSQATMEPLNCTVQIDGDVTQVWVGHQAPSVVKSKVAEITKTKDVNINIPYLGGGFGRRAEVDFVTKAAEIATHMPGTPIQLHYTREEDMRYGMYRPTVASRFKAAIGTDGKIEAWQNNIALQSVGNSSLNRIMPSQAPDPKDDPMSAEGAAHLPYTMTNRLVAFGHLDVPVQVGNWRSVGSSQNGFFTESFMDECAHAAGQDPYLFRKNKLKDHPRFTAVLDKVAALSKWSEPLAEGKFRGIALHKSFGSIVGQVAEISQKGPKEFSIDHFYCVIDCGRTVNPDTVEAQMQSGIVYGLSAAMYGKITIEGGKIVQGNFPEYEMVRMNVSPGYTVHIMEVDDYPGGVGEPATPPAAPALANAIFAATGDRVRKLPMIDHGYTFV